jgi:uncharacterized glyoxalase superfamily protein PhnB
MSLLAPIPILRIFDEARARDFYIDYLGFSIVFEHRFEPNSPIYMGIARDSCVIHLSEHNGDGTPGSRMRINLDDVTALHGTLDPNYRYARPGLQEQPYGTREFSVADPFGNTLIFSQDI